jgi:predicted nucleotidyltransferase component of viral defense system
MHKIPLHLQIKKKRHREIATAQDLLVEILYRTFPRAVLHGGTAIWRCYCGNRFSEDLDVYLERDPEKIELLFETSRKHGFEIRKKRIRENSLYSALRLGEAEVGLEATFRKVRGVLKEYQTCGGNLLNVYTLPPEDLIEEKVEAYLKRLKVRDLYDVFFLLRYVEERGRVRRKLLRLLQGFRPPVDEEELKTVLLSGAVPTANDMLEYLRRWCR